MDKLKDKARIQEESKKILEAIKTAKTAVVVAHVNPDGDTLGSMLAIAKVLEQAGVKVDRVMHDRVPEVYSFFPDQEKVACSQDMDIDSVEEYDLSFSCDCGSIDRLGTAGLVWQKAKTTCNIDHHLSNPLFADLNWVDPDATSTGQVVNEIIDEFNKTKPEKELVIDKDLASLMYITLLTDTAGFRHSNTNQNAFNWASALVALGADPSDLYNRLFNQIPYKSLKIIGSALADIEMQEINAKQKLNIAYTTTTRAQLDEYKADDEDTDEIVDHVMRIKNLDMCLYLREGRKPNSYKGSLRSACAIDCSKLAQKLNGGGHARAAGFNLEAGSFKELKDKVYALIQEEANNI